MNIEGVYNTKIGAALLADMDRASVGENCNPYLASFNKELYDAYNARYEQIEAEWNNFVGSAA